MCNDTVQHKRMVKAYVKAGLLQLACSEKLLKIGEGTFQWQHLVQHFYLPNI